MMTDEEYLEHSIRDFCSENIEEGSLGELRGFFQKNIKDIVFATNQKLKDDYNLFMVYLSYVIDQELEEGKVERIRWIPNDCPYDHSGELINDGYVDASKVSLIEYLEMFRQGHSEATYESGCGLRYPNYGDRINEYVRNSNIHIDLDNFYDTDLYEELREFLYENTNVINYTEFYNIDYIVWVDFDEDSIKIPLENSSKDKDNVFLMKIEDDNDEAILHECRRAHVYYSQRQKVWKRDLTRYTKEAKYLLECAKNNSFSDMLFDSKYLTYSVKEFASLWRKDISVLLFSPTNSYKTFNAFQEYYNNCQNK